MEWLTSRASVETGMCSRGWGVLCPVFTSPTPLWSPEGLGITVTELGGITPNLQCCALALSSTLRALSLCVCVCVGVYQ